MSKKTPPSDSTYRELLQFRLALRRFVAWSRTQTAREGVTPTQHLLLLVIRGHDDATGPSIGQIAQALVLRHHSAVELVDRAEKAGLVVRTRLMGAGGGTVHVRLSSEGSRVLRKVTRANLQELQRLAPELKALLNDL